MNKKMTAIVTAIETLKDSLAEVGIEQFELRLLDIEDAAKIEAAMSSEIKAVRPPRGFDDGRPMLFHSKISGVPLIWHNVARSPRKNPNWVAQKEREAKERALEAEADRVARNARAAFLADRRA